MFAKVEAVLEIPRGSRNKYEYDHMTGVIRLDRVLYSSVHYPTDPVSCPVSRPRTATRSTC